MLQDLRLENKSKLLMIYSILNAYFANYWNIKKNKTTKIKSILYFTEDDSVNVFQHLKEINQAKKVKVTVSLLYNFFDDQMNIIRLIVNGKRQSEKTELPESIFV